MNLLFRMMSQEVFEINTTILGFFFTQVNIKATLFKEAHELCKYTYPNLLFETFGIINTNFIFAQQNSN